MSHSEWAAAAVRALVARLVALAESGQRALSAHGSGLGRGRALRLVESRHCRQDSLNRGVVRRVLFVAHPVDRLRRDVRLTGDFLYVDAQKQG